MRVGLLMSTLRRMPRAYAFMGNIEQPGGHPHRDPKSKWHVTPEEWGAKKYPPWAHGAGALSPHDFLASGTATPAQQPPVFCSTASSLVHRNLHSIAGGTLPMSPGCSPAETFWSRSRCPMSQLITLLL